MLVSTASNIRQPSVRMVVTIAAICGFALRMQDVAQAYLQAGEELRMEVYIKTPAELQLGPGNLLRIVKFLYGLSDSGDYWYETFSKHLRKDFRMEPSTGDMYFYYRKVNGKLSGIIGSYVDFTI